MASGSYNPMDMGVFYLLSLLSPPSVTQGLTDVQPLCVVLRPLVGVRSVKTAGGEGADTFKFFSTQNKLQSQFSYTQGEQPMPCSKNGYEGSSNNEV
jgi:hypothetical protein